MKQALRTKWIAALTSGDYRQGRCALYWEKEDLYCCLGVLRHIADPEDRRSVDGQELSGEQLSEFGLGKSDHNHLMTLNDGGGYSNIEVQTFNQIAEWIGENL